MVVGRARGNGGGSECAKLKKGGRDRGRTARKSERQPNDNGKCVSKCCALKERPFPGILTQYAIEIQVLQNFFMLENSLWD